MRATAGSVHVWRIDLTAVEDGLEDLLCADERARAARILPARKRVLWVRSRCMLRALLGRYLERDPRALRFELDGGGKPALASPKGSAPAPDLRFSLSHSGSLALVAVTVGQEVGVDVERARARYTAEFLSDWVAREAVFKCRGNAPAPAADPAPAPDLWTAELDVGADFAAAVAVESGRCRLQCGDWPGGDWPGQGLGDWPGQGVAPPVSVAAAMSARKAPPGWPGSPGALPPPSPQM